MVYLQSLCNFIVMTDLRATQSVISKVQEGLSRAALAKAATLVLPVTVW